MPVREILQQFVDRCTRIDVRARSGDVIVPNAPAVVKMLDMASSAARNGADRGAMAIAANMRIVTGYCGMQWDQSCSVATETYGVFLMSPDRELRL